jgi:hypothetical protein
VGKNNINIFLMFYCRGVQPFWDKGQQPLLWDGMQGERVRINKLLWDGVQGARVRINKLNTLPPKLLRIFFCKKFKLNL